MTRHSKNAGCGSDPKSRVPSRWTRIRRRCADFVRDFLSQFSTDPLERCRWIRFPATLKSVSANPKDQLARDGENEAEVLLSRKGYGILHRNIRFPEGEIDLIVRDGKQLVFVEVKTRRKDSLGKPYEAVNAGKRKRMILLAEQFLALCQMRDVSVRFDIVSIVWPKGQPPQIDHVQNAFQARDLFR